VPTDGVEAVAGPIDRVRQLAKASGSGADAMMVASTVRL
jgi:hypothetical protein